MPKPAAGCDEIREWLGAYVIGVLEPGEDAPIEAHLAHCPACRSERDSLADVARLLRDALPLLADADSPRPPRPGSTGRTVRPWRPRQSPTTGAPATRAQTPPKEDTR
ncbi:zf-HC2 domain-containing protein [Streptomyces sp. TRM68367]|uniref:zf-HC2 domain-containing protein n=1 Tax=Streptomyces sp. TRM68367 TaxID=2758415 RepID=UPI00165AD496|nr:zf-HC2 domain-containing protein [Streptomyces sp. TRM68367]MBC9723930.1 zf-HC2 domain-containing protein [Streptomyces sp. TRM68367]